LNKFVFHALASGAYTALCLASLSIGTDIIITKSSPNWLYFSFLFFSSFLYYNFQKISWFGHRRMSQKNNLKYLWPAKYPGLLLLCLMVGFIGSVALITSCINNPIKIFMASIAFALAVLYNQNILGIHLRSSKGFKAFTIAMVAIITGVLIPAAKNSFTSIPFLFLLLFSLAQLCFITALCIAADMRDIEEDREDRIKTFPAAAGILTSKRLILLLFIFQLLLLFIQYNHSFITIQQLEAFFAISLLSMIFIHRLEPKNSYSYFIIGIDGLIACQSLSVILIQIQH
jgi:1,4-dihydroxy-2-naphthoate octaprenyltransferase